MHPEIAAGLRDRLAAIVWHLDIEDGHPLRVLLHDLDEVAIATAELAAQTGHDRLDVDAAMKLNERVLDALDSLLPQAQRTRSPG